MNNKKLFRKALFAVRFQRTLINKLIHLKLMNKSIDSLKTVEIDVEDMYDGCTAIIKQYEIEEIIPIEVWYMDKSRLLELMKYTITQMTIRPSGFSNIEIEVSGYNPKHKVSKLVKYHVEVQLIGSKIIAKVRKI